MMPFSVQFIHGVKMEDQFSHLFLRPPKTLPQCKIVKDVLDLLSTYFVQIFQIKMSKLSYPPPTQSALLLLIRLQNRRSHSQKQQRILVLMHFTDYVDQTVLGKYSHLNKTISSIFFNDDIKTQLLS